MDCSVYPYSNMKHEKKNVDMTTCSEFVLNKCKPSQRYFALHVPKPETLVSNFKYGIILMPIQVEKTFISLNLCCLLCKIGFWILKLLANKFKSVKKYLEKVKCK